MRFSPAILSLCFFLLITNLLAEEADDFRAQGIAALKDSQSRPHAIVDAARHFVKAAELYTAAGNEEKSVEMNSFLYWCKKKMTLQDIDAFTKGGESAVLTKFATLEKVAPKTDEAQTWFERAGKIRDRQSRRASPDRHSLFSTGRPLPGQRRQPESARPQFERTAPRQIRRQQTHATACCKLRAKTRSCFKRKPADSTGGQTQRKRKKTIKDLFKAEYAKTDSASCLALVAKLLQQADENKDDAPALDVLRHTYPARPLRRRRRFHSGARRTEASLRGVQF